jgi:hypothetical protein
MRLLIHSCKSTQNAQETGGQNAKYSVKGGFSDENPPFVYCWSIKSVLI